MNRPLLVLEPPRPLQNGFTTATIDSSVLPDSQARDEALNPTSSFLVEAPAGSGKTGLLIQRYLKLLGQENVTEPEQVLAITFTQKATAEIRERVLLHLVRASNPETPKSESPFDEATRLLAGQVLERDCMLGWNLLSSPTRLNVRTIDSVCAEIARALPVLSESGGTTSPTPNSTRLYREAARRTLLELGGEDPSLDSALQTLLLHRDGNLEECELLLSLMLSSRDQWGDLVPLPDQSLTNDALEQQLRPRLERSLELAICPELSSFTAACPPHLLQQLATLAAELAERSGYKDRISPLLGCSGKHLAPGEFASDLEHWRAILHLLVSSSTPDWRKSFNRNHIFFETSSDDRKRLHDLVQQFTAHDHLLAHIRRILRLPPAQYPNEQWTVLKALFRILRHTLLELQLVFAEHGTCDFAQIGLLARQAIERDTGTSDLTSALGMRLQHLLVDEMQDTSTSQYRLLELLTQHWDGHSQTVFLVGDPKQSIYLFRQGRVERFLQMMQTHQFGDLPLSLLRLTANFRSRPALVDSFNHDFSRLFTADQQATDGGIAYTPAVAVREPLPLSSAESVNWHIRTNDRHSTPSAKLAQLAKDCAEIRSIVKNWLGRPLPNGRTTPWKIAVLVRDRKHLHDIMPAFHLDEGDGAIPVRAIDIEPLAERQEILDLIALTRALLHPADRVAWLGLLRSPPVGLGLADLHLLVGGDDSQFSQRCILDLVAERGHLLADDSATRLERFWLVMNHTTSTGQQTTLSLWVEQVWNLLGGSASLTPPQQQNAQRFFQLLEEIEQREQPFSASTLQENLKDLFAESSLEPGAVDLLTIHKAKGLEWDVVIVPAVHRRGRSNPSPLLRWEELSLSSTNAVNLIFAPVHGKGQDSHRLNDYLKHLQTAREADERQRLFYVACTRAREELHLFAAPDRTATGEIGVSPASLLGAAWPAVQHRFASFITPLPSASESTPEAELIDQPLQLAASAESAVPQRWIHRLPLSALPSLSRTPAGAAQLLSNPASPTAPTPEASFSVRAFGNAVHAFLDLAAAERARGTSLELLRQRLPSWLPRINSVLRAAGLSPAATGRAAEQVLATLQATADDPTGAWILYPHHAGATEFSLTSMHRERQSVRIDRLFYGGPEPLAAGEECLWIIDYKTASRSSKHLHQFLGEQRQYYAPQLENYAQILGALHPERSIRVGLYYPVMARLDWWVPDQAEEQSEAKP